MNTDKVGELLYELINEYKKQIDKLKKNFDIDDRRKRIIYKRKISEYIRINTILKERNNSFKTSNIECFKRKLNLLYKHYNIDKLPQQIQINFIINMLETSDYEKIYNDDEYLIFADFLIAPNDTPCSTASCTPCVLSPKMSPVCEHPCLPLHNEKLHDEHPCLPLQNGEPHDERPCLPLYNELQYTLPCMQQYTTPYLQQEGMSPCSSEITPCSSDISPRTSEIFMQNYMLHFNPNDGKYYYEANNTLYFDQISGLYYRVLTVL